MARGTCALWISDWPNAPKVTLITCTILKNHQWIKPKNVHFAAVWCIWPPKWSNSNNMMQLAIINNWVFYWLKWFAVDRLNKAKTWVNKNCKTVYWLKIFHSTHRWVKIAGIWYWNWLPRMSGRDWVLMGLKKYFHTLGSRISTGGVCSSRRLKCRRSQIQGIINLIISKIVQIRKKFLILL